MDDTPGSPRSERLSRRRLLTTAGSTLAATFAGCGTNKTAGPEAADVHSPTPNVSASATSTGTATGTETDGLTLESGTIGTHDVPSIASSIPVVDPLIVSAIGPSMQGVKFTQRPAAPPKDTLRFNVLAGGWPPKAMSNYLLAADEGNFVRKIWLGILDADVDAGWRAVVSGVNVWFSADVTVQMMRDILADLKPSYETVADTSRQLIVRGPKGDVAGFAPNVASFVPASRGSFPFSPLDRVTAVVETAAGVRPALYERDSTFKRVLRHAPLESVGHVAYSRTAPLGKALSARRERAGPGFGLAGFATGIEQARAVVSTAEVARENEGVPATATVSYEDPSAITESALITNLGNRGANRTYVRDDMDVQVDCLYSWNELEPVVQKRL